MLLIRPTEISDASVLNDLIHEMAEYERLPVALTSEIVARDGFGERPQFWALLAEWDGKPAGYAFFFFCYSSSGAAAFSSKTSMCGSNFEARGLATLY